MNNLLFTALIIALLYYFFYYLPSQKKLNANLPLQHHQSTQTEPDPLKENNLTQEIEELKSKIKQLEQDYRQEMQTKHEQITSLQSQIRDLTKRPLKPTNSKSTQTDSDLENTLDTLIKDIQDLNNSLN